MRADSSICIVCKGSRLLCGERRCPLLQKQHIEQSIKAKLEHITSKSYLFGSSPPNIFVGRYGYPDVSFGPFINVFDTHSDISDNPAEWYGLPLEKIISFRSALFRPVKKANIKKFDRQTNEIQEAVLSTKPVDMETKISSKPHLTVSFSSYSQPMGPSARMESVKICENPKIPDAVDEIVDEKMKAVQSMGLLYEKGFDSYYLTKVLSAGILGINKKIVPTRWSIVAVEDMISKKLIEKIKTYPLVVDYEVYHSKYLSNHFEILLTPGNWEFENFEAWAPGTLWSQGLSKPAIIEEYEGWEGRTRYAELEGGGYYASRFSVTEALNRMRRQARVVVFREISAGYTIPVGSWEIKENVKHAFLNPPRRFSSLNEALQDISSRLQNPLNEYLRQSKVIGQTRLVDF